MSDLKLTPKERELAEALGRDRNGVGSRLGFYASVLVPIFLFAGYGIFRRDLLAVELALLGLLVYTIWRISRELAVLGTYRSLWRKVAEHERKSSEQI